MLVMLRFSMYGRASASSSFLNSNGHSESTPSAVQRPVFSCQAGILHERFSKDFESGAVRPDRRQPKANELFNISQRDRWSNASCAVPQHNVFRGIWVLASGLVRRELVARQINHCLLRNMLVVPFKGEVNRQFELLVFHFQEEC